jgi:hypothetical protein
VTASLYNYETNPQAAEPREPKELHICVNIEHQENLPTVKDLCLKNPGNLPIYLHLKSLTQETVIAPNANLKVCGSDEFCKDLKSILGEDTVWKA